MSRDKTSQSIPKSPRDVPARDQLQIRVPKGEKKRIAAFAKAHGESMNAMITRLIREALEQSE